MRLVISSGSRTWGGLELMAVLLARGLQQRGHEVIAFCRRNSPLHEHLRNELHCVPILHGSRMHPGTIWSCMRALRRHRSQVVIANTMKDPSWTGIAARLLGIPVLYRHEIDIPYENRLLSRLIFGWVPACHIVNSEATRGTLLSSIDWLPADRIAVLPNGIDLHQLTEAEPASLGLPNDAVAFGFVGRWEERKGIRELAAAWPSVVQALPHAHLVIAGWGPMERELRDWLAYARNVHWIGFRDDVPSVMKALDVLVAPSHYEGFGLVLAEAMGVGTPVVGTRASSIPELVDHGVEGLLVPARDADALAEAMIELGRDPELRARMGTAGQARVRRDFTVELMLDRHEQLLEEIIRAAPPRWRLGSDPGPD